MDIHEKIQQYITNNHDAIFDILKELVVVQSGSQNKKGVDKVANLMSERLGSLGLSSTIHPNAQSGDLVKVATQRASQEKSILLIGHMDTAFPPETDFTGYSEDAEKAYGPGVVDMKGGLTTGFFALAALEHLGLLADIPLIFLLNPDEEVGSPNSLPIIKRQAQKAFAAFVLEAACPQGQVITSRNGRLSFELVCKGKSGHAAYTGPDCASAIHELVHQVVRLYDLHGFSPGLTVNVGQITGGVGPNVVADSARAVVDVRMTSDQDGAGFMAKLEQLLDENLIPGAKTTIENLTRIAPMEPNKPNEALYNLIAEQAQKMGQEVGHGHRPDCSDANTLTQCQVPVVDGMGPIGGGFHSDREFMIKNSLPQRATLLALSLWECWQRRQKGLDLT
jgi:glutamate carboxypeptidase